MSVDYSSFSIAELLAERTKVDAQLTMKTGGAAVASVDKKGAKKPSKRAGKPTVTVTSPARFRRSMPRTSRLSRRPTQTSRVRT